MEDAQRSHSEAGTVANVAVVTPALRAGFRPLLSARQETCRLPAQEVWEPCGRGAPCQVLPYKYQPAPTSAFRDARLIRVTVLRRTLAGLKAWQAASPTRWCPAPRTETTRTLNSDTNSNASPHRTDGCTATRAFTQNRQRRCNYPNRKDSGNLRLFTDRILNTTEKV